MFVDICAVVVPDTNSSKVVKENRICGMLIILDDMNIFYSRIKHTENDCVQLKVLHYPLQMAESSTGWICKDVVGNQFTFYTRP